MQVSRSKGCHYQISLKSRAALEDFYKLTSFCGLPRVKTPGIYKMTAEASQSFNSKKRLIVGISWLLGIFSATFENTIYYLLFIINYYEKLVYMIHVRHKM